MNYIFSFQVLIRVATGTSLNSATLRSFEKSDHALDDVGLLSWPGFFRGSSRFDDETLRLSIHFRLGDDVKYFVDKQ